MRQVEHESVLPFRRKRTEDRYVLPLVTVNLIVGQVATRIRSCNRITKVDDIAKLGLLHVISNGRGWEAEEQYVNTQDKSLRRLIDKWVAATPASAMHVTRLVSGPRRCVRVEVARAMGSSFVIYFFRYHDGTWGVTPPTSARPMIGGWSYGLTVR
jgi:hypothetical protein